MKSALKSESREAENRREQNHESSRKTTSVIKAMGKRKTPSDRKNKGRVPPFTRDERHQTAPLDQNLGSNRNCGQKPEFDEGKV